MTAEEIHARILEGLRRHPFEPFCLVTNDGRRFEVPDSPFCGVTSIHPGEYAASEVRVGVGVDYHPADGIPDGHEELRLSQIVAVEPLLAPAARAAA